MKVLIVYDSKYGNTEKVAKLIAEGITSTEGNEVIVNHVKDVKLKEEASYDLILVGSPNHFGRHIGSVKKFINKLPQSQLKANAYAVFDTYIKTDFETAVKRMEEQISEVMPGLTKASPGLSIKVEGAGTSKGPIVKEELPKCKEFGIKLAQG
ncbi:MAG: flavodoxin family protein [Candidatus Lokiarchaeota archaeon]|nr:flavodoxin family protein [Candidatus Lokiarchaeota archaeon]